MSEYNETCQLRNLEMCLVGELEKERGTKVDAAVRYFENFWQFYDLVQVLLCAD